MKQRQPVFTALTPDECQTVLARNHVGRLAFVTKNMVDIEPVHYAAADSWLFVRSAGGSKLEALAHNPFVAFEVDEIEGTFDWRSVVARGTIYVVSEIESRIGRAELDHAVTALRTFVPETLARDDPTPFRTTVYGVHVDQLTGRRAEQRTARKSRAKPLRVNKPPARRPSTPHGF